MLSVTPVKNQLLYKVKNAGIAEFSTLKNLDKNLVKIPHKAKTFDFAKVSLASGVFVDILTFRKGSALKNKQGNILKQFVIRSDNNNTEVKEKSFKYFKETCVDEPNLDIESEFYPVLGRKISTVIKKNGNYKEKQEEIQAVTYRDNGQTPVLHISKIQSEPFGVDGIEYYNQSLFKYEKGAPVKGYKIEGSTVGRMGNLLERKYLDYSFEGFTPEVEQNLKEDRYFPLHLYSFKHFKHIAPSMAVIDGHETANPCRWYKKQNSNERGFYDGWVNLNARALDNRYDVIRSGAHENEHGYQHNLADMYEDMAKNRHKFSAEKLEEARKCWEGHNNYINSTVDIKGYFEQYVENQARIAGRMAEKEYRISVSMICDEFPYAPNYMLGASFIDDEKCESKRSPAKNLKTLLGIVV